MSEPPPSPACIERDDYSAANSARRRVTARSRRFISLPNLKFLSKPKDSPTSPSITHISTESTVAASLITLDSGALNNINEFADKYEWAVVYENQRGMTLFSIPYYSQLGLLPTDPPPFTIPNVSSVNSKQTSISLDDYPLPDGTWKWVSKCWMIDMRSDTGEVQHDGFEYNWLFRTHKWSAEVGRFSAGGWVRRRRWIRLMMRPARYLNVHGYALDDQSTPSLSTGWYRQSVGSSLSYIAKTPELLDSVEGVWTEGDTEGNWLKCRLLLKQSGRDGRKLELWKTWLSGYRPDQVDSNTKGKSRQTQDVLTDVSTGTILQQAPPKEYLIPILRTHGAELLSFFIYPDSRANFLTMLAEAGLIQELNVGLGSGSGASVVDFWSYVNGMPEIFQDSKLKDQT